ncbi:unnamed protein product [Clonostachys rosea f. rosea IK726]|uniref:Uncharacterized protein n=3 Tax=Bionectria ochroleuca TaxID=29856 RepID=A0A0B7KER1_BIOOC|nr:unnamed protein product [Clonostachys rosea f. rosea IK726]
MSDAVAIPASAAYRITSYTYNPTDRANPPENPDFTQATHRINVVNGWGAIPKGGRVLEIGCGQGLCTTVLAEAVGPAGTVDAIDPGSLDYGAPVTLGQAYEWITDSEVGSRINWHQATPEQYLSQTAGEGLSWDVAVLAHCIWYFKSPEELGKIFRALSKRVKKICIAEYALTATAPAAVPHVLAVLARAALESQRPESDENVQNILTPDAIKTVGKASSWNLEHEGLLVPQPGLQDGFWEVGTVHSDGFLEDVEAHVQNPRLNSYLKSSRDAVIAATSLHGGLKAVLTMDVWLGTFSS